MKFVDEIINDRPEYAAPLELDELVFTALGAASVCWDDVPTGVFHSERAHEIGEAVIAWINEHYTPKEQHETSK